MPTTFISPTNKFLFFYYATHSLQTGDTLSTKSNKNPCVTFQYLEEMLEIQQQDETRILEVMANK